MLTFKSDISRGENVDQPVSMVDFTYYNTKNRYIFCSFNHVPEKRKESSDRLPTSRHVFYGLRTLLFSSEGALISCEFV